MVLHCMHGRVSALGSWSFFSFLLSFQYRGGFGGQGVAFWEYYEWESESDNRTTRHNEVAWLGAWDNSYLLGLMGKEREMGWWA